MHLICFDHNALIIPGAPLVTIQLEDAYFLSLLAGDWEEESGFCLHTRDHDWEFLTRGVTVRDEWMAMLAPCLSVLPMPRHQGVLRRQDVRSKWVAGYFSFFIMLRYFVKCLSYLVYAFSLFCIVLFHQVFCCWIQYHVLIWH